MEKFFIEIGSADMDTCIPLAENGWKGIIVEPVKAYLQNLKRIDGVVYENIGISGDGANHEITYLDLNYYTRKGWMSQHEQEPHVDIHAWVGDHSQDIDDEDYEISGTIWARGLGSMVTTQSIDDVIKQFPSLQKDVRTKNIETLTLNELLDKHSVMKIDFLKMDVEGMEYDIISNYDWVLKPSMMKIEYHHFGDKHFEILDLFNSLGYKYWIEKSDVYAIL